MSSSIGVMVDEMFENGNIVDWVMILVELDDDVHVAGLNMIISKMEYMMVRLMGNDLKKNDMILSESYSLKNF